MLILLPNCECCDRDLPPESDQARICTYECTFCADCAEGRFGGICPNCGGNFVPRPIRPSRNWKGDNYLGKYPPSDRVKHRPVDATAHAAMVAAIGALPPDER